MSDPIIRGMKAGVWATVGDEVIHLLAFFILITIHFTKFRYLDFAAVLTTIFTLTMFYGFHIIKLRYFDFAAVLAFIYVEINSLYLRQDAKCFSVKHFSVKTP